MHIDKRICQSPTYRCLACPHFYGKADVCEYAGEEVVVTLFEDENGTRRIYSDSATGALHAPVASDKVLAVCSIHIPKQNEPKATECIP